MRGWVGAEVCVGVCVGCGMGVGRPHMGGGGVQTWWWGVLGHAASFIFRALSVMSLCECVSQLVSHCPMSAPSVIVPGQWSVSATGSLGESSLTHSLARSLS